MPVLGCIVLDQMKMKKHHTSRQWKHWHYLFLSTSCIQVGTYVEVNYNLYQCQFLESSSKSWFFMVQQVFGVWLDNFGGLNKEHFIQVHWVTNSLWRSKALKSVWPSMYCNSLVFIQIQTLPSGKKMLNLYAKNQWKFTRVRLPLKSPIMLKDDSIVLRSRLMI